MSIKSGWGTKLGGFVKSWKRRWFVLFENRLEYYTGPGQRKKGEVSLNDVSEVSPYPECVHQHAFKLVIPNIRTYQIYVDNNREMEEWVKVIRRVLRMLSRPKVNVDDFVILKVIGKGTYGKVQLVKCTIDGKFYAMKSLSKKHISDSKVIQRILQEKEVLIEATHPFLVSAHYAFQTEAKIFLIMDYIQGGDLFNRIREERKFSFKRVQLYAAQLTLAIGHLHSLSIMHRDLKPENILFDKYGYMMLTDFGLVKRFANENDTATTFCGTPEYVAPEMVQGCEYTKSVDWWALGTMIYELLYGFPPFYDTNTNAMYRSIVCEPIELSMDENPVTIDFLCKILDKNPYTRLGSGSRDYLELKEHPFFEGVDWNKLLARAIPMEWVPHLEGEVDVSQFDSIFTHEIPKLTLEDPSLIGSDVQKQLEGFTFEGNSVI